MRDALSYMHSNGRLFWDAGTAWIQDKFDPWEIEADRRAQWKHEYIRDQLRKAACQHKHFYAPTLGWSSPKADRNPDFLPKDDPRVLEPDAQNKHEMKEPKWVAGIRAFNAWWEPLKQREVELERRVHAWKMAIKEREEELKRVADFLKEATERAIAEQRKLEEMKEERRVRKAKEKRWDRERLERLERLKNTHTAWEGKYGFLKYR